MSDEEMLREVRHIDWEPRLAHGRAAGMKSSIIRELLKLTQLPDIISFAGGLPAPELFPVRGLRGGLPPHPRHRRGRSPAVQHDRGASSPAGVAGRVDGQVRHLGRTEQHPHDQRLTAGSRSDRQAVRGARKLHLHDAPRPTSARSRPGTPTRPATSPSPRTMTACWSRRSPASEAAQTPRLIYVLPNFHNPAGTTMPLRAPGAPGRDRPGARPDPDRGRPVRRASLRGRGHHAHLPPGAGDGPSTSAPSPRPWPPGSGWAGSSPRKPIITRFVQAKQGADLHTGTFVQMMANDICQRGILKQHVKQLRAGLPGAARRHAGGHGGPLAGGLRLDAPARRALPLGPRAGVAGHAGSAAQGGGAEGRLRARDGLLPGREPRASTPCA